MRRLRPWTLLLFAMACGTPETDDTELTDRQEMGDDGDVHSDGGAPADTDLGDTDAPPPCAAQLDWMQPAVDATNVRADAAVRAGYTEPLPDDPSLWHLGIEGVQGKLSVSRDGLTATFQPVQPLVHDRVYSVVSKVCGSTEQRTFSTGSTPIDVSALSDRVWAADLADLSWVAPAISNLFLPLLDMPVVLVEGTETQGDLHFDVRLAFRDGPDIVPLSCTDAVSFGLLDMSENPRFVTEASDFPMAALGSDRDLEAVQVAGQFSADGSMVHDLSFQAMVDLRIVEDLTGLRFLCNQAALLGQGCQRCNDGTDNCLPAYASLDEATEVTGVDIHADGGDPYGVCP